MKYVFAAADFCGVQDTLLQAALRWLVLLPMIFVVVVLDNYFHSSAPAAAFGYALGSLTTLGSLRKIGALGQ